MPGATTEHYGLNKPDYLESPWNELINANFDTIDTLLKALAEGRYSAVFTAADLVGGILTVAHNLNAEFPSGVMVWNNNRHPVTPKAITSINANSLTVDLSPYADSGTITGDWYISIRS